MTNILVVDDHEENRYLLQVLLGSNGYEVTTANDGAAALEAARSKPPDLAISDILMPGMDGFALCRAWVNDDLLRQIPFVFYTATYTGPEDERLALSLGAVRFITKPMETQQFLDLIQSVLQDSAAGKLARRDVSSVDEAVFLTTYNAALVRKLEEKLQQLAAANQALEADIAARIRVEEELRLHSAALASAADAVVITDREGSIRWINPAFTHLTGYGLAEVIGMNPRLLTSGSHDQHFYEILWDTILDGETWRGEIINRRKDGSLYVEQECITPVRDAAGEITHFVAIKQDITERNRTESAERDQRALAEALSATSSALASTRSFDEVLDRIMIEVGRVVPHDAARVILLEHGHARTVRCRGEDDQQASLLSPIEHGPIDAIPNLQRTLLSGRTSVVSDTRSDPGWLDWPKRHWVRSHASSPITIKGQVTGFLSLDSGTPGFFTQSHASRLQAFSDQAAVAIENARLHDESRRHAADLEEKVAARTTELTQREADLRAANERLTELDRLKSKFVSNVSHELRTPLGNIKLYLELLEGADDARRPRYMATLTRETDLLYSLIEDLLQLSRLDQGTAIPSPQRVDLGELVTQLVGDRVAQAQQKGLTLAAEVSPELPPAVAGIRMLRQVFSNLITNAMNYTPAGGSVTVRAGVAAPAPSPDGPAWLAVSVTDTGLGISAEDQAHLFERFYRGEAARVSKAQGTGLGLAICDEIVRRHRGRITVESQQGEGTTITVWLPAEGPRLSS